MTRLSVLARVAGEVEVEAEEVVEVAVVALRKRTLVQAVGRDPLLSPSAIATHLPREAMHLAIAAFTIHLAEASLAFQTKVVVAVGEQAVVVHRWLAWVAVKAASTALLLAAVVVAGMEAAMPTQDAMAALLPAAVAVAAVAVAAAAVEAATLTRVAMA